IKYAAKQSSISNAHKKWIGESKGLKRLNAIEEKQKFEAELSTRIEANADWNNKYGNLLAEFESLYQEFNEYQFAREYFIELFYYGPEIFQFSSEFTLLVDELLSDSASTEKINGFANMLKPKIVQHFKDYDAGVDQDLYAALTKIYAENLSENLKPEYAKLVKSKYKGDFIAFAEAVFKKTIFVNRVNLSDFVFNP